MKKRLLALIPVMLVVFLCSNNIVHAEVRNGSYITNNFSFDLDGTSDNILRCTVRTTSFWEEEDAYQYSSSSGNTSYYGEKDLYKVLVRVNLINDTNKDIQLGVSNFSLKINVINPDTYTLYLWPLNVEYLEGLLTPTFVSGSGEFNFAVASDSDYVTWIVIPAYSQICSVFEITYQYTDLNSTPSNLTPPSYGSTGVTWYYPSIPITYAYVTDIRTDNLGYIQLIYKKLRDFVNSYNNNVPASQNVTNESSALETQSDTIHSQETGYYTQTNTALANTGLSNYQFSSDVVGGMGKVKEQFTYVWNKLGNYNVVYVFSLTLSIALMIIRHVRPIRRKQEE